MDSLFRVVNEKTSVSTVLEINAKEVVPVSGAVILIASDVKTVEVNDGAVLKIEEHYYMWNVERKALIAQIWSKHKKKRS